MLLDIKSGLPSASVDPTPQVQLQHFLLGAADGVLKHAVAGPSL